MNGEGMNLDARNKAEVLRSKHVFENFRKAIHERTHSDAGLSGGTWGVLCTGWRRRGGDCCAAVDVTRGGAKAKSHSNKLEFLQGVHGQRAKGSFRMSHFLNRQDKLVAIDHCRVLQVGDVQTIKSSRVGFR